MPKSTDSVDEPIHTVGDPKPDPGILKLTEIIVITPRHQLWRLLLQMKPVIPSPLGTSPAHSATWSYIPSTQASRPILAKQSCSPRKRTSVSSSGTPVTSMTLILTYPKSSQLTIQPQLLRQVHRCRCPLNLDAPHQSNHTAQLHIAPLQWPGRQDRRRCPSLGSVQRHPQVWASHRRR